MKKSKFLTMAERQNGDILVHSGASGTVMNVKKDNIPEFNLLCGGEIPQENDPLVNFAYENVLEVFRQANIILDDEIDEIHLLEQRYHKARIKSRGLALSIAPSMECNLACPYCYNPNQDRVTMNSETIDAVASFVNELIETKAEGRSLLITWVGGEPLYDFKVFSELAERIYKITERLGCQLFGTIVTNGTLLTEEVAAQLREPPFVIKQAQIALDGPAEIHDKKRCFRDKRPSYNLIRNNIKAAQKYFNISVRIHVDANIKLSHLEALVKDYLVNEVIKPGHENINFYLGKLHSNRGCEDICESPHQDSDIISVKDFAALEVEFAKLAKRLGLTLFRFLIKPGRPLTSPCGVMKENNYAIDASGNLGKCWHYMGEPGFSVGSVFGTLDKNSGEYHYWSDYNPFEDTKCRKCKFLPLCVGGCPSFKRPTHMRETETCSHEKYNLKEQLLMYFYGEY